MTLNILQIHSTRYIHHELGIRECCTLSFLLLAHHKHPLHIGVGDSYTPFDDV